jgi:O-antigen/teichoic acid export membrane protein
MAREGLSLWLGAEFADNSTFVLKWLAAGVFINGLARVPFALVQGAGRPDLTAKMHLVELPFYLAALWFLLGVHGIEGAAVVWVLRSCVDTLVLFVMVRRILPGTGGLVRKNLLGVAAAAVAFILAGCVTALYARGTLLVAALACFAGLAWTRLLAQEDRELIKGLMGIGLNRGGQ